MDGRWRRDGWLIGAVVLAVLIVGGAAAQRARSDRETGLPPAVAAGQQPGAVWGTLPGGGRPNGAGGPTGAGAAPSGRPTVIIEAPGGSGPLVIGEMPDAGGATPTVITVLPPLDRPPGPGSLVYSPCVERCHPMLRGADGRTFLVPTDAPGPDGVTLSPDGHWLVYPVGTGVVVRSLVDRVERRLVSPAPDRRITAWAWSADSSLLLSAAETVDGPVEFTLVNVHLGAPMPVSAWAGQEIVGVRVSLVGTPELLMVRPVDGFRVGVGLASERGDGVRWLTLNGAGHLQPGERLRPDGVRFGGSGFTAVAVNSDEVPVAVLRFDAGGAVMSRQDLTGPGRWTFLGAGPRGAMFTRHRDGHTEIMGLGSDRDVPTVEVLPGHQQARPPGIARH